MWKFEQSTGRLFSDDGKHAATGYAGGAGGKVPESVNNPAYEQQKGVGPLPKGKYKFGYPGNHPHLGPFAIPLIPYPENEMYNRDSFFCHGDNFQMNESASDGCIIMPRQVREEMWNSPIHDLEVV